MPEIIINSAEEGMKYLEEHRPSGQSFQLNVSNSFTFVGKSDVMGAGMAVFLDKILGAGYLPDGFEQKSGFRIYNYTKME